MATLNLRLKGQSRSGQVDENRREALNRLHMHLVAVDDLIRAFEQYQRFGPARASAPLRIQEKCS